MNTSILIVGTYEFLNELPQIHEQADFSLEIVTSVDEARSYLRRSLPDILLVQASIHNSEKFCQWSKEQSALNSPYCILLEDRPQCDRHSCTWDVEQTAAIIEDVADAYIDFCWLDNEKLKATNRLILAHIQVGRRNQYQELIDKNNTLSAIALADPLTQLNNRRAMERDLPAQILASRSNKKPLSLLMLDVDCFKTINDTYGHLVGDRVLQLLSSRLKHNLRSQELLFRYGGEEFVIILNNIDCQQGLFIAERLRRQVGEQIFTLDSALSLTVTISIGAACLQSLDDRGGIALLTRADNCLLSAKVAGRNCVIGCTEQLCATKQLAIAL
ncbi:GGDEF domain-containing protein [Chlorogloea sp. CCALA 695]|uniref:GGDEF domain-containing protein n=1 Tax=Chlorogloea sp. CCALA 695 TaxID=2107693 RepID=UPI000D05CD32|nr:GGDEF domain-containing protein [Chlorogloea sp. CCALA 695]PSB35113.1 GGDEF domain-containing protein [Chlorogloea sp. CCALA 695]